MPPPHSLPSFAQAFSSLPAADDRDLPPIHAHNQDGTNTGSNGNANSSNNSNGHPSHHSRDREHDTAQRHAHAPALASATSRNRVHQYSRPAPPSSRSQGQNQRHPQPQQNPKKRPRASSSGYASDRSSPQLIKEEHEYDQLDPSPSPTASPARIVSSAALPPAAPLARTRSAPRPSGTAPAVPGAPLISHREISVGPAALPPGTPSSHTGTTIITGGNAPPPSLARPYPPSKRRRFTVGGTGLAVHSHIHGLPHPLNTANLPPGNGGGGNEPRSAHAATTPTHAPGAGHVSTPISPVVMGFTVQPNDVEQVRAMLSVKQKQKALIESRRGSIVGAQGPVSSDHAHAHAKRGSTAGLLEATSGILEGRRGSVHGMQQPHTMMPSVNIVNPTPTTATAVASPIPPSQVPKRTGPSPNSTTNNSNNSHNGVNKHGRSQSMMSVTSNMSSSPNMRTGALGAPVASSQAGPSATGAAGNVNISTSTSGSSGAQGKINAVNAGARALSPVQHVVPSQNLRGPPGRSSPRHQQNQQQTQQNQQVQQQAQLQQVQLVAQQGLSALAHNLPPPPNSFARRRAGQLAGRGNKPADIMISPRDSDNQPTSGSATNLTTSRGQPSNLSGLQNIPVHARSQNQAPVHSRVQGLGHVQRHGRVSSSNYKALQPAIQSAPAIPRSGQEAGQFPPMAMALPSLPPTMVSQGTAGPIRRGQVPPTPTGLTMQRTQASTGGIAESASVRLSQPTSAMPLLHVPGTGGAAFGPGGMPVTPATLHRASNTSADKLAFLAPFEQFYDALSDAQVLKGWFGEQLRRVGKVVKDVETQRAEVEKSRAELERQREEMGRQREEMGRQREELIAMREELVHQRKEFNMLKMGTEAMSAATEASAPTNGAGASNNPRGRTGGALSDVSTLAALVEDAVQNEERIRRDEITHLNLRMGELEALLWQQQSGASQNADAMARRKSVDTVTTILNGTANVPNPTHRARRVATPGDNADSYTFPPVQRPAPPQSMTAPTPTFSAEGSNQREVGRASANMRQSQVQAFMHTARSTSPSMQELARWSVSRSAASSPAPSVESGISGGVGPGQRFTASVSATRYEPPLPSRPPISIAHRRSASKGASSSAGTGTGVVGDSKNADGVSGVGTEHTNSKRRNKSNRAKSDSSDMDVEADERAGQARKLHLSSPVAESSNANQRTPSRMDGS